MLKVDKDRHDTNKNVFRTFINIQLHKLHIRAVFTQ